MRIGLIGALCICTSLAACGQPATSTEPAPPHADVRTQPNADAQFLAAAAMYENYQIEAAAIAAEKGQSHAVKTYAANAAAAHRAALAALVQAAGSSGMPAPAATLNDDYRAYLDRLRADDATPFDVRYVSQQTLTTMSMAGRYDAFTSIAPDSALKSWAATRSAAVHDDIKAAHQLAAATR